MNLKTHVPMLLAASLAGFAGGAASNSRIAQAQQSPTNIPYIQTKNVDVIDQSGKVRIRLSTSSANGASGLEMFDGTSTNPKIVVGTLPDGTSNILLMDGNGKRRASFDFLPQGSVRLALVNAALTGGLVLGSDNESVLIFSDNNKKKRAAFGMSVLDDPGLGIYDGDGKVIWSAPPAAQK